MDIVSRLKKFLELTAIPITQFADTATIPRPTLSQILNGRNKKISNEILDKIHTGYPDINMMWLMFGDGEMMANGATLPVYRPADQAGMQPDGEKSLFSEPLQESPAPIEEASQPASAPKPASESPSAAEAFASAAQAAISLGADPKKKIQNIMVFYNDNSFEIFVPANR